LAFVREVAKIHGGSADFANAASGGAVVRLALPR
jgi:two-component system sensor histidine kinase CreC